MVYVLSKEGKPLMPTKRYKRVRLMLDDGRAKVVRRDPFTIQLTYTPETNVVDRVMLSVDPHRDKIGISAISEHCEELFAAEVIPRQDVHKNVLQARQLRQSRRRRNTKRKPKRNRYRSTRYRKAYGNIVSAAYIRSAFVLIGRLTKILPITNLNMEISEIYPIDHYKPSDGHFKNFPNQRSIDKYNVKISSKRSKILARDRHVCQCCYGNSKDPILVVKKMDKYNLVNGIMENAYITLCKHCRDKLDNLSKSQDITDQRKYIKLRNQILKSNDKYVSNHVMRYGITRKNLFDKILRYRKLFGIDIKNIKHNYGYFTKFLRRKYNVEYSPINNARLISNIPYDYIKKLDNHYIIRYRKHHDRSLHKITPKKGGVRPPRSPKVVHGFQSYDLVKCYHKKHPELWGKTFYITKKRKTGYFGIGKADGTTILQSVKYDCLKLVKRTGNYSIQIV